MFKFNWLMLAFLACVFSAPVGAKPSCVTEFKRAAKQIPYSLERRGYTAFGRLNLQELRRGVDTLEIVPGMHKLNDDLRSTGYWTKTEKGGRIELDCEQWRSVPSVMAQLALHEVLGPLDFYDDHYWISNMLWLLSLPVTHKTLNKQEVNDLEAAVVKVARAGGGIIGVGGGGESESVAYNSKLLLGSLHEIGKARSSSERGRALTVFEYYLINPTNFIRGSRLNKFQ